MHNPQNGDCADCGREPPPLGDGNTLRSAYGWRLSLDRLPDGSTLAVWRCPECAARRRASRPG